MVKQYPISHPWGRTPLVFLSSEISGNFVEIAVKDESRNPSGSIKVRAAIAMIQNALEQGILQEDGVVIEPTSGNTGIGLAFVCIQFGLRLILTMPESMSIERRKLLTHLGAELVLTPAGKGMTGAVGEAENLLQKIDNSFMPDQFSNPMNPQIHYKTTAGELLQDYPDVDIFVAGVGTGGTITGVGRRLKDEKPEVTVVAVEPAESAVLSGKPAGKHSIEGIGAGFIPNNLDMSIIDEVLPIKGEDAIQMAQKVARIDGLVCGISSGAAVAAAVELAKRPENRRKRIATILPDGGERYFGTKLFSYNDQP